MFFFSLSIISNILLAILNMNNVEKNFKNVYFGSCSNCLITDFCQSVIAVAPQLCGAADGERLALDQSLAGSGAYISGCSPGQLCSPPPLLTLEIFPHSNPLLLTRYTNQ